MNIISLVLVRTKKSKVKQKRTKMSVITIIKFFFEVSGEIQFKVIGEKEVFIA
ncbi:hypothetical protein COF80_04265 [Bacillus toyonensis]|uniref:hypothetical protein n=1 Tax=Bacillus toyonensis TaxID=155322 RepID=UPI000BEF21F0|nr:hypothetical protein [Bacillus toyonensis]PEM47153.1 hypothetical protein CN636_04780 [Bacillus toyonensis]PHE88777.1 hypothetical protein COF80_04265 [Bacillus toyonensis]